MQEVIGGTTPVTYGVVVVWYSEMWNEWFEIGMTRKKLRNSCRSRRIETYTTPETDLTKKGRKRWILIIIRVKCLRSIENHSRERRRGEYIIYLNIYIYSINRDIWIK